MVSARFSLALGILPYMASVPTLLPVLGFALGANSYLKENKKTAQNKDIKTMATIGMLLSGFATVTSLARIFLSA